MVGRRAGTISTVDALALFQIEDFRFKIGPGSLVFGLRPFDYSARSVTGSHEVPGPKTQDQSSI
jgi:hypothetical protein